MDAHREDTATNTPFMAFWLATNRELKERGIDDMLYGEAHAVWKIVLASATTAVRKRQWQALGPDGEIGSPFTVEPER